MPKAVLDSTVLVSAFLAAQAEEILQEAQAVLLRREHLRSCYTYTDEQVNKFCVLLRGFAHLCTLPAPLPPAPAVRNDTPIDNES